MSTPDGVILSCIGTELTDDERSFLTNTNPFGFILFKRNFESRKKLINLINELKTITKNKRTLIFVDQEGGKVQRLKGQGFSEFQSQKYFGDI